MNNAILILLALFILGSIVWEIASWSECLETQSWWYCLRILGK